MGTHPIFESDFDCLTDLTQNDFGYAARYVCQPSRLCHFPAHRLVSLRVRSWSSVCLPTFSAVSFSCSSSCFTSCPFMELETRSSLSRSSEMVHCYQLTESTHLSSLNRALDCFFRIYGTPLKSFFRALFGHAVDMKGNLQH